MSYTLTKAIASVMRNARRPSELKYMYQIIMRRAKLAKKYNLYDPSAILIAEALKGKRHG